MARPGPTPLLAMTALLALLCGPGASPALADAAADGETAGGHAAPAAASGEADGHHAVLRFGYRLLTPSGAAGAAEPYTLLTPGIMGGLAAGRSSGDNRFSAAATVIGSDDYHAEATASLQGRYRLHLESEALNHNLPGEVMPSGAVGVYRSLENGAPPYALRTTTSQAVGRARLGELPVHLELGYWQLHRSGTDQLRFSDHYSNDPASTVISAVRRLDGIAREGQLALDAQLGSLGLAYDLRLRDFVNDAPVSRHQYAVTAAGALTPALQAHDVTPGSRVVSHTVKAYSDMSGGLSAAGSYSITTRENNGSGGDAHPSSSPADTLQSVAGDLNYTPFRELTLALKYRHLDIGRERPATVSYPFAQLPDAAVATATPGVLAVRPAVTTARDQLSATALYRPSTRASLRLEYRAELESRERLPDPKNPASPSAAGSDSRQTHGGSAVFTWHPHNGIRLSGSYGYQACDNPATSASFSERHDGRLSLSYSSRGVWGATAGFQLRQEQGDSVLAAYRLPRDSRSGSASASFWATPLARLTVSSSYAYQRAVTDQSLLLAGNPVPGSDPAIAARYLADSHVYGIDAVYAMSETLDLMLSFQQVFSRSLFELPERDYPLLSDLPSSPSGTAGITGLSRTITAETGGAARLDWHAARMIDVTLDYTCRVIRGTLSSGDGSLHATMLSLMARW